MNAQKHREETRGFLIGTLAMVFLAVVVGHDALQGFRTGEWVNIGAKETSYLVPWWLAAAISFGFALFALWCFSVYVQLKRTAPAEEDGEKDGD